MSARAEDAARALSREQPTTADAAVPAPANNGSADAEGVEIPAPEPSGNKNLLHPTGPALMKNAIRHVRQVLATWRGMLEGMRVSASVS